MIEAYEGKIRLGGKMDANRVPDGLSEFLFQNDNPDHGIFFCGIEFTKVSISEKMSGQLVAFALTINRAGYTDFIKSVELTDTEMHISVYGNRLEVMRIASENITDAEITCIEVC